MPVYNMPSGKPYIGCRLGLISKAQNRYEGILYTIDTINSAVVLENVKCFGTEGRPTDKPVPPKRDLFEYITFRGSDIKDITVCEPPGSHQSLPNDPAIMQSGGPWSVHHTQQGRTFSPVRMAPYNHLASSRQYDPAHGFVLPGQLVRRALMVEKGVQTALQTRELPASRDQGWDYWGPQVARAMGPQGPRPPKRNPVPMSRPQDRTYRGRSGNYYEAGLPPRRGQDNNMAQLSSETINIMHIRTLSRRKNNGPGWQMADYAASSTLKFDTDFDFDTSNAQFIKEVLGGELRYWGNAKGHLEGAGNAEQDSQTDKNQQEPIGPKCNYDKEKSFFDKLTSENAYRPTWAEERRRNIETFGVPGLFPRNSRGYRGSYRGGYQGGYRGSYRDGNRGMRIIHRSGSDVF